MYQTHDKMFTNIRAILIKKKNTNASKNWLRILPDLSRQLELCLYINAPNMKEYSNLSTLSKRLVDIYYEVNEREITRILNFSKISS